jgi:hypothetical protein
MVLVGCGAGEVQQSDTGEELFNQDNPSSPLPVFTVGWSKDTLDITITGGEGGRFWFGAADLTTGERWTGEDCYRGDNISGSDVLYCHPISTAGAQLALGGDPLTLVVGQETALDPEHVARIRYYFVDVISEACWLGGPDTQYYDGFCDNVGEVAVQ